MLRITCQQDPKGPIVQLEGRLVGPWVSEFEKYWQSFLQSDSIGNIQVDLRGVTAIDESGKNLLGQVHHSGGTFIASGCLTKSIVEQVTAHKR